MDTAALPEPTSALDIIAMVGFPYMALVSVRLFRESGGELAGLGMSMALAAVLGFLTWFEIDFAIPLTVNATDGTGHATVEIPVIRTLAEFAGASVFAGLFVRCLDAWRVARDYEALLRFQRTAVWIIIMLISGVVIYEVHFATTLPMRTAILSIGGASVFIVGLAMQSTLGNMFAGYGLQSSRVFRRGDTVQLGRNGAVGTVFDSTLATTRIITRDGEMLVLPNSAVLTKDFMNLDQPNSHLRQSIKIGISYEVPPAVFKDIAMQVLLSEANVLRTPEPAVWLADFGESSVQYDLRFWVDGFDVRDATLDQVRTRLWYAVADAGIEIPFPIRTIRMA
ncbi:MAG: mechanosensitive ion channel family protein, partial [Planctomycetes bacterium]|nr:mechanosensitive ion channel family protein [Planctomycetota bacterium]